MVAIYARQSLDKKDSISIETQIELCKKELVKDENFKVYEDKGFSGKNTNRPAFTSLYEDIENGLISKIVVYRLDRISRSITDFSNIIDFLEDNKVSFVSVTEKFDTSTPIGRAMLYIVMVFAQLERETIADRITDNYFARGKTGVWLGGTTPLGFKTTKKIIDNKKVSVLEVTEDIEIVKEIFELYGNPNLSLGKVAKVLHEKYGGSWDNIKLSRILSNPIYVKADADIYRYYKSKKVIITSDLEEFDGIHSAMLYNKQDKEKKIINALSEQILSISKSYGVIDSNLFLYVANKKLSNKQIKNTAKGTHSYLTGLAKCGYCGYSMRLSTYKNEKYFNCSARTNKTGVCDVKTVTHYVNEIEDFVFEQIKSFLNSIDNSSTLVDKSVKNDIDVNTLKIDLINIESEIEALVAKVPKANDALMTYINNKIDELDTKKTEIENQINSSYKPTKKIELPDVSNWEKDDIETKRNISHALIDKVLIFSDNIKIVWKY